VHQPAEPLIVASPKEQHQSVFNDQPFVKALLGGEFFQRFGRNVT